jgi:hypothetical protein
MKKDLLEETIGSGPNELGIMNEGFADPCTAKKEPYSPIFHFRIRCTMEKPHTDEICGTTYARMINSL